MSTLVRKVYVAGPMTGYPQFNIPAFVRMAERLRRDGVEVVSPVERDSNAVREAALASPDGKLGPGDSIAGETWGQILARDVTIIADEVDGVVVLPNWEKSKGARLEVFTALLCKKPIYLDAHWGVSGGDDGPMPTCLMLIPTKKVVVKVLLSLLD